MLPGVELARRRRVHYHGDAASSSAAAGGGAAGEHHHQYYYAHAHRHAGAAVAGPAMAARIRLEEKLRGAALPSATSPSRAKAKLACMAAASIGGSNFPKLPMSDRSERVEYPLLACCCLQYLLLASLLLAELLVQITTKVEPADGRSAGGPGDLGASRPARASSAGGACGGRARSPVDDAGTHYHLGGGVSGADGRPPPRGADADAVDGGCLRGVPGGGPGAVGACDKAAVLAQVPLRVRPYESPILPEGRRTRIGYGVSAPIR
ncbi:unnamed protein product [Urochloa humidicola]